MKVAGTDNTGYIPVHGKCLVKHNAKKLDCVRELEVGASHLNTSGSIRTSESGRGRLQGKERRGRESREKGRRGRERKGWEGWR